MDEVYPPYRPTENVNQRKDLHVMVGAGMKWFGFMKMSVIFQLLNKIKFFNNKNDPVHNCPIYKIERCIHVDGYLCVYPDCKIIDDKTCNFTIIQL